MKRFTAALLCALILISIAFTSCGKKPGKNVSVGDVNFTLPDGVEYVTQTLPESIECYYTDSNGTVYDLYKEDAETLKSLSTHSHETKYPVLIDKQNIADVSAFVFGELFSEKGVVYNGANFEIKANPTAKSIICTGRGNDGGYAALAIEKSSGEIIMIVYCESPASETKAQ